MSCFLMTELKLLLCSCLSKYYCLHEDEKVSEQHINLNVFRFELFEIKSRVKALRQLSKNDAVDGGSEERLIKRETVILTLKDDQLCKWMNIFVCCILVMRELS